MPLRSRPWPPNRVAMAVLGVRTMSGLAQRLTFNFAIGRAVPLHACTATAGWQRQHCLQLTKSRENPHSLTDHGAPGIGPTLAADAVTGTDK
jgi:hypothetical protein